MAKERSIRPLPLGPVERMLHRYVISSRESHLVVAPDLARHARVTVLIAIIRVRSAVILQIATCTLHAIAKSLPRKVTELVRWRIPSAPPAIISVSRRALRRWPLLLPLLRIRLLLLLRVGLRSLLWRISLLCEPNARRPHQCQCKHRYSHRNVFHRYVPPVHKARVISTMGVRSALLSSRRK
jgi:hypothetical protein